MPHCQFNLRRSVFPVRCWASFVALSFAILLLPGCRPAFESTEDARPVEIVEKDARENGGEAARWPQWRGPQGSGVAPGGSPPVEFGPDRGERSKVDVPGEGSSSPVVWDEFVLLTTALQTTVSPTLAVLCYDRGDGSLLWQTEVGQAVGPTHVKNGYASASVATDGQRIYAFFGATGLFAIDFAGNQLWRTDLGNLEHEWGAASSPILDGDTVIQVCESQKDSYIAAFDTADGNFVWKTERGGTGVWSTPVLVEAETEEGSRTELVVNGSGVKGTEGCVIAYDPGDGVELWRVCGTEAWVTPTPLVHDGLVICASGRSGPIMAIRPGGSGDVTDTHLVWIHHRGGPYIPTGLVYRNRLFLIDDSGVASCFNPGSGEQIWKRRLSGPVTASLIAGDGRVYAVTERGRVYVLAAADKFELLAENELGERCLATPAIAEGELLVRTKESLYCFAAIQPPQSAGSKNGKELEPVQSPERPLKRPPLDPQPSTFNPRPSTLGPRPSLEDAWPLFRGNPASTGVARSALAEEPELLWEMATERGGFEGAAAIADGAVFAGCLDGFLYALDLATGQQRWKFETDLGFVAAPAVRGGRVFVGDSDGCFYAIDAESGQEVWRHQTEAEINSGANFYRDTVVFGSQDARLYRLKIDDGELVWKVDVEDQIRCMPSIVGHHTFVAGCNAKLNVIDLDEGKLISGVDLGSPTLCTPAIVESMAYVGTDEGKFFAIDWRESTVEWTYENRARPSPFWSSAAVTGELVIVGSRDKMVHALDRRSGERVWTFTTKARVDSSPAIVGSRVFVGSSDGRLYALDLKTGEERWQFETGGSLIASPAVAEGRLVIGNDEGVLFCFGEGEGK